jgi:signal transduction histidine kinase
VQGSGLGLVITHQLIERMGGSLEVQSTPEIGSTFTVRIPRLAPAPAAHEVEAARHAEALGARGEPVALAPASSPH